MVVAEPIKEALSIVAVDSGGVRAVEHETKLAVPASEGGAYIQDDLYREGGG